MKRIVAGFTLLEALRAEGYPIPDECREIRLVMTAREAFVVQLDVTHGLSVTQWPRLVAIGDDVYVTDVALAQIGRALQAIATANDA